MTRTISLRIDESLYKVLKAQAEAENRSISNFVETATLRYLNESEYVDDFEMEEIRNNKVLVRDLRQGLEDAQKHRGRFV